MKNKAYWEKRATILKGIAELKAKLANTDYMAIKYAEGVLTLSDYLKTKEQRQAWRAEINALEANLRALEV